MLTARRFPRTAGTLLLLSALTLASCTDAPDPGAAPAGSEGWLTGSTHEKFDVIADQLGGFGDAMVQIGYRYIELYWAGEDRNWEYAAHQLEEMTEVFERALVRRPARAASSRPFLDTIVPDLEKAIEAEDHMAFTAAFGSMVTYCNACHAMEDHAYIEVWTPTVRIHPWGTRREN